MQTQLDRTLVRDVVAAGDNPREQRVLVERVGVRPVAEVLVAELAARRAPWHGPVAVEVAYEIGHGADRSVVSDRYGDPGGPAEPVRVEVGLVELWTGVYGPGGRPLAPVLTAVTGDPSAVRGFRQGIDDSAGLVELAVRFDCDKWGLHYYAPHYERHFAAVRDDRLTILEIGVGGGDEPASGGASLRMWKRFFPRAMLYGVDIFDKSTVDEPRITTFCGDQSDPAFLDTVVEHTGVPDIVIDDGSHVNAHVIASFNHLFPKLRTGGLYVVEDLQTAYWPRFGGSSDDLTRTDTSVGHLKALVDGLNHEEFLRDGGYRPSYTDRHVTALHFYHNLAVVEKGDNTEGTILDVFPGARERAASSARAE